MPRPKNGDVFLILDTSPTGERDKNCNVSQANGRAASLGLMA